MNSFQVFFFFFAFMNDLGFHCFQPSKSGTCLLRIIIYTKKKKSYLRIQNERGEIHIFDQTFE